MIDRGGEAGEVGRRLLGHSDALFEWWHRVRDATLARSSFQTYVATMRPFLREDLERGAACACPKTAGTCRELLAGERHLWTFVRVEEVEPTNNDAERALRHGVIYRKTSGGTASESGSRFVERLLKVVATWARSPRSSWSGSVEARTLRSVGAFVLVVMGVTSGGRPVSPLLKSAIRTTTRPP